MTVSIKTSAMDRRPHRLQGAMFTPIGDAGRAELVEKRLTDAITGGHLRAGDRLPSEADLARTMGVSPVTVREALLGLRVRGLVVTRRGRHGGSFVSDTADPLVFARDALRATSRLALRDLGMHYAALTMAGARLAARRATAAEVTGIRSRLARLDTDEPGSWRLTMDDLQLELVALSQSARITRDQMRLQAELSPLLRLIDVDPAARAAQRGRFEQLLDAVEAGDEAGAAAATERAVDDIVRALDALHMQQDDA